MLRGQLQMADAQVVLNLLGDAIKYTPGGGSVPVRAATSATLAQVIEIDLYRIPCTDPPAFRCAVSTANARLEPASCRPSPDRFADPPCIA
jgi:hypothetical protein